MDKKKAAAAAVTVAAAAGMVTGAAFDSPADLMQDPPAAVAVQTDDDDSGAAPEERQSGPAARIREWVLSLPAAVRMLCWSAAAQAALTRPCLTSCVWKAAWLRLAIPAARFPSILPRTSTPRASPLPAYLAAGSGRPGGMLLV